MFTLSVDSVASGSESAGCLKIKKICVFVKTLHILTVLSDVFGAIKTVFWGDDSTFFGRR